WAKMLWPTDLCVYYPLSRQISLPLLVCSALLLMGISLLAWRAGRHHPYFPVAWLWYLVMLIPVIGFVQVSGQAMADRYTYTPLVGVFMVMVWGAAPWVESWSVRPPIKLSLIGAVLLSCFIASAFQLQHWRNG